MYECLMNVTLPSCVQMIAFVSTLFWVALKGVSARILTRLEALEENLLEHASLHSEFKSLLEKIVAMNSNIKTLTQALIIHTKNVQDKTHALNTPK